MKTLMKRNWGADITPWNELETLGERLRRVAMPEFAAPVFSGSASWAPPVELTEGEEEFVLTAEVPGLTPDDLDLEIDDGVLTLQGEKRAEHLEEAGRGVIRERSYGQFERSFTLPRNVQMEKIEAEFHDGLVEIHLPKGKKTNGRHIEIKAH